MPFDYKSAQDSGYSDAEITDYLANSRPDFDMNGALNSGYSLEEISGHLASPKQKQEPKPDRSILAQGGRIAEQYALGLAQGSVPGIVYDLAVAPLNSEGYNVNLVQERIGEDLENLYTKKAYGEWTDKDQEELEFLQERMKNPSKIAEEIYPVDISIRGLTEKVTGQSLHPEGWAEKAANFVGFLKDPQSWTKLKSLGISKEALKEITPNFMAAMRGAGAGGGLEMAEQGNFGPLGTIFSMIIGDAIGAVGGKIPKIIMNPKQFAAEAINYLTLNNTQRLAAAQLAEDFSKAGMTIDPGTLTGSPLIQTLQARLSQSGLTGVALDNLRKELSNQVVKQYEDIVANLGELAFENDHQAAEAVKSALKVEDRALNAIPQQSLKEQMKNAPTLQGRIAVVEPPNYQETLLNEIAPAETRSTYQKGEHLKETAEGIKAEVKQGFDKRFTDLNQKIAELPPSPQRNLATELENFIEQRRGSLLLGESAPEARVLKAAEELYKELYGEVPTAEILDQFGKPIPSQASRRLSPVTIGQLIKTKRTLGDVANWEFHGSNFESAYKKLVKDIDDAILESFGNNIELRNEFLNLNADYSLFKNEFENDAVKNLFMPKNQKFNSLYREFSSDIDKLKALEAVAGRTEEGQAALAGARRDFAQKIIEKPNLTAQDLTDLRNVLGPEYDTPILNFITERNNAIEHPLPHATPRQPLGIEAELPTSQASRGLQGRVSETSTPSSAAGARKKLYEQFTKNPDKATEKVMQSMNSIEGIRELKKVLGTTAEGKKLFEELSRYKLAEMIDKKMADAVTNEVKHRKFAGLLSDNKSKAIVKELLGEGQFNKLQLLQKNSGAIAESAGKFFNASKSGVTVADAGLMGTAIAGLATLNPFLFVPAATTMGGSYVIAKMLADKKFMDYLLKAIKQNNPKKFMTILEKMQPIVAKALTEQHEENETE